MSVTDIQSQEASVTTASGTRYPRLPMPSLEYTEEVARETAPLYEKVKHHIPEIECRFMPLMSLPSIG